MYATRVIATPVLQRSRQVSPWTVVSFSNRMPILSSKGLRFDFEATFFKEKTEHPGAYVDVRSPNLRVFVMM